jgi:phage terminase large subunit-like protein
LTITRHDEIRLAAERDLVTFIKLVHPQRVLGGIHEELCNWWTRDDARAHQLVLLPRDHGKSAMVAYRVAWEITKNPTLRVLYISSTANLAEKQLKFIKDILTSRIYRRYWPEMIHEDEGKREKWTNSEISVDHPLRKAEAVRDPTVFTAGLTTGIVGLHCDIAVLDDVVVGDNAYNEDGRLKVQTQYSYLASIEGADAKEWAVGTRYHPLDLYNDMIETVAESYDEEGQAIEGEEEQLYEVFERVVEDIGDGTGQFLWPRQQRADGKWFGFDARILATKRAKYLDKTQFRAQYYNDPNDIETADIKRDFFQYYDKTNIAGQNGVIYYSGRRLNVFAAVDFAYSLTEKSDYTAIVVVGVDSKNNYYILDISRFKTDRVKEYFDQILLLHRKWGFHKMLAEVTAAQKVIVKDIKENYIRPYGLALSIVESNPTKKKEDRIQAALGPRYENMQMWHYRGGNCEILENELVLQNPPHDDIKDCLASIMQIVTPPSYDSSSGSSLREQYTNRRFGGIG